jgi:hypothetical protein
MRTYNFEVHPEGGVRLVVPRVSLVSWPLSIHDSNNMRFPHPAISVIRSVPIICVCHALLYLLLDERCTVRLQHCGTEFLNLQQNQQSAMMLAKSRRVNYF